MGKGVLKQWIVIIINEGINCNFPVTVNGFSRKVDLYILSNWPPTTKSNCVYSITAHVMLVASCGGLMFSRYA